MLRSSYVNLKSLAGVLAFGLVILVPEVSRAQGQSPNAGQGAQPGVRRATGLLSNPVNYRQMSQVTGVGPISGSVRIYNLFGVLYMQSAFGGAFGSSSFGGTTGGGFGGGGGGFGGGGAVGGSQNSQGLVGSGLVPGIGSTAQGDDAPPGVLLHVNYANLLNPLQSQLNTNNSQNSKGAGGGGNQGGGGGGFGGQSFNFGNGGDGL